MIDFMIDSRDGTPLHGVRLEPEHPTQEDILLVHGLAEHMGRYQHVASTFARAGHRVTGIELRGHGDSGGPRGHVDSWDRYADDLRAAQADLDRPHYIVAHSMGGLVALYALLRPTPADVLGLVLSDPLLGVAVKAPRWKTGLARLLSRVAPRLPLGNELDVHLISRDPEVVRRYEQDPKVFRTVTPRWYTELQRAIAAVDDAASSYTKPLLMLIGEADAITSPAASRAFFEAYGTPDKDLVSYPGLFHELFNEPEKERVFADVLAWMQREATIQPAD